MKNKKKLLLLYPRIPTLAGSVDLGSVSCITNKKGGVLNVGLATIAALTPPGFDVRIHDENLVPIDFDRKVDIVGIGPHPSHQERVKEIAAEYRRRGALVVGGGPSVTVSPERWRSIFDVMFIGEAERTWPQFISDYLAGRHATEYRETEWVDLSLSPIPDYSGYRRKDIDQYVAAMIQTSRGCPFNCEFCAVVPLHGRKVRNRPIDVVMEELEKVSNLGIYFAFLADENFAINHRRAKELLRRIRDWNSKKRYPMTLSTSVTIDAAQDEELLRLLAEAGVIRLTIGVESPNEASLKESGKTQNLRVPVAESIRKFHEYGLLIQSGVMVGFDQDDLSIFRRQYEFFTEAGIANVAVYPVQALDGTALKERMIREGRYIPPDLSKMARVSPTSTFTFVPKQMTLEQLRQGSYWLFAQFYNFEAFARRFRTFLENFERSPVRHSLRIPSGVRKLELLRMSGRFLRFWIEKAAPDERRALRQMLRDARRSSHPNSIPLAIASFLIAKDLVENMRKENPRFAETEYPLARPVSFAS